MHAPLHPRRARMHRAPPAFLDGCTIVPALVHNRSLNPHFDRPSILGPDSIESQRDPRAIVVSIPNLIGFLIVYFRSPPVYVYLSIYTPISLLEIEPNRLSRA